MVWNRFRRADRTAIYTRSASEVGGYVRKHDWIDYSTEVDNTELRFKGRTDPLIVDSDSVPIVPIEVKTRKSVESLDSPSPKHRAQLHAYIVGLSRKYEIKPPDGVILYGSRETFDVKTFHIEYSEQFWDEVVVPWAATQTTSLLDENLPPADPEQEWECGYCSYRERCGKGKSPVKDSGAHGFVPGYTEYPHENVEEYLRLFPSAAIPSAIASKFPDLASDHSIQEWSCDRCGYCAEWDAVKSAGEPLCPECAEDDILISLSRPEMPTVVPDE
ncbi:PD-(D/E)XK nuclease family protein [Halobaculum litoreum]|uniref:PD-(D/E)XK nuclease family protein n=1 Tax=Halobaculum litoreum TaxID=3031998 RepID=A0ABD5XYX1_9EURY